MAKADVHNLVFDFLNKNVIDKNVRIVDLAAGQGAFSKRLIDNGFSNVKSVDLTDEYWKIPTQPLTIIDLTKNFSNELGNDFDIIIALEIIEHIENPYHFLRQIHKSLKKGGMLFLSTPNVESTASRLIHLYNGRLRYFSEKETDNHHITPIYGWYLENAFRKIGYSIMKKCFTTNSTLISNSFKSKLIEPLISLFNLAIKGDKLGENRIYFLCTKDYMRPLTN